MTDGRSDAYGGARFVPVIFDGASPPAPAVGLAWRADPDVPSSPGLLLWLCPVGDADKAQARFRWMLSKPECWTWWSRLAIVLGPDAFGEVMDFEEATSASVKDAEN